MARQQLDSEFRGELSSLLNRHSLENGSDTPDFVLSRYLESCLQAYDMAVNRRAEFFGEKPKFPGWAPPKESMKGGD